MHGFHDRALALVLAVGLLLFGAAFANAGPYEDALAGLTTNSFGDTADAIEALTASGDPRTGPILEALKDQRLLYSAETKRVFITGQIRQADGCSNRPAGRDAARRYR